MPSQKNLQNIRSQNDSIAHKELAFKSIVFTKDTGYIYTSAEEIPIQKQLFSELSYQPQEIRIIKEDSPNNLTDNILLGLIFLGFVIMALIRNILNIRLYFPFVRMLQFKSLGAKESGTSRRVIETGFYILFFIAISIFSVQAFEYFNLKHFGFQRITLAVFVNFGILASIAVFKLLNYMLYYIFEDISFLQYYKTLDIHITGISVPLFLTAAAQYPVSGFLNELFMHIGLGMLLAAYLIKITKYIYINYLNKLRFYYLFLYLCALEAVPLLIVIKLYTAE
jgi:hypothetical protein